MSNKGRKHGIFAVESDSVKMSSKYQVEVRNALTIDSALEVVFKQMKIGGNRARTIQSYDYIFRQLVKVNQIKYVEDISADSIYYYLDSIEVSQRTKLIRLKTIKAVLSKFYNNGWFNERFWSVIQIKVDKEIKSGTKTSDIATLLQLIDQATFVGFRDATAIKLMYKTGIRIRTLGELKERHIDFTNLVLDLDGSTLKNHKHLKLPLDEELASVLKTLIQLNKGIREYYKLNNFNLFITQNGLPMNNTKSSNCAISKQLNKYAKKYGLSNINAHAIRRAYAKSLLDKGASIALISKALGHSDLAVTTQYLDLDVEEVVTNLRKFL